MAQIETRDVTLKIIDGTTPTPNELVVKMGEGNFQYTVAKNIEYKLDKGNLDTVREGDQIPVDISFEFIWEEITGGSATGALPSIEDALERVGNALTWISSAGDPCEPYATDLQIFHDVPCNTGGVENETILFADFRPESIAHDLQASQISVSGKANIIRPTVTKSPST